MQGRMVDTQDQVLPTARQPSEGTAPRTARQPLCSVTVTLPGAALVLTGRLDVRSAADVRLAVADAISAGEGELVLDVAGVAAIDATGLGVLVGGHRRAGRAGRSLVLRDPTPALHRALLLTRLDRVLRTERTACPA